MCYVLIKQLLLKETKTIMEKKEIKIVDPTECLNDITSWHKKKELKKKT